MATLQEMLALHRYYFWAGCMRSRFADERKKATTEDEVNSAHFFFPYLPYYLAGINTIIEGWERLRLRDAEIDALLVDAERRKILEAFRHGVYHFHPEYYDTKFRGFWAQGRDASEWTERVFAAFDSFFRRWFAETKLDNKELNPYATDEGGRV